MNLDLFKCEICHQVPKSPQILNCCNCMVCRTCLVRISFPCDKIPNKLLFNCPSCFKQNDELKCGYQSVLLEKTIKELGEGNEISPVGEIYPEKRCTRCDISIDRLRTKFVFCASCSGATFCDMCSKDIHAIGKFREHLMVEHLPSIIRSKALSTFGNKDFFEGPSCIIHDQPLQSLCLRDYSFLCASCESTHKSTCKSNLIRLGEADSEIAYQLMLRIENLSSKKKLMEKEKENLKMNLDLLNRTHDEVQKNILTQFNEFRDALFVKEKELLNQLEIGLEKRKLLLEKEMIEMEAANKQLDSLCSALNLACNSAEIKNLDAGLFFLLSKSEKYLATGLIPSPSTLTILNNRLESLFQLNSDCLEECKSLIFSMNLKENMVNAGANETKLGGMRSSNNNMTSSTKKLRSVTPKRKNKQQQSMNSVNNSLLTSQIVKSFEMTQSQVFGSMVLNSERGSHQGQQLISQIPNPLPAQFEFKSQAPLSKKIDISDILRKKEIKDLTSEPINKENYKASLSSFTNEEASTEDLNASGFFKNDYVHATEDSMEISQSAPKNNSRAIADLRSRSREISPMVKVSSGVKMNEGHIRSQTPMDMNRLNKSSQPVKSMLDTKDYLRQIDVAHYTEIIKNPLAKRIFTKKLLSSTSVYLAWSFSTQHHPNLVYQVEYGIGTKVNGKEQFRKVYEANAPNCVIGDLQPKTTYRVRVRTAFIKDGIEESTGEWSDVTSITLFPAQMIDLQSCGTHAALITKNNERFVQFDKSGLVTACNEYSFGKVCWEVKLQPQSAHFSSDDCSCIKLGVTNKTGKVYSVIGSTFNHGCNKNQGKFKLALDFDKGTLTIYSQTHPNGEIYSDLPPGPLFPAFQNKMGKNSVGSSIKLLVNFDVK